MNRASFYKTTAGCLTPGAILSNGHRNTQTLYLWEVVSVERDGNAVIPHLVSRGYADKRFDAKTGRDVYGVSAYRGEEIVFGGERSSSDVEYVFIPDF